MLVQGQVPQHHQEAQSGGRSGRGGQGQRRQTNGRRRRCGRWCHAWRWRRWCQRWWWWCVIRCAAAGVDGCGAATAVVALGRGRQQDGGIGGLRARAPGRGRAPHRAGAALHTCRSLRTFASSLPLIVHYVYEALFAEHVARLLGPVSHIGALCLKYMLLKSYTLLIPRAASVEQNQDYPDVWVWCGHATRMLVLACFYTTDVGTACGGGAPVRAGGDGGARWGVQRNGRPPALHGSLLQGAPLPLSQPIGGAHQWLQYMQCFTAFLVSFLSFAEYTWVLFCGVTCGISACFYMLGHINFPLLLDSSTDNEPSIAVMLGVGVQLWMQMLWMTEISPLLHNWGQRFFY